jgi:hypothetical protein
VGSHWSRLTRPHPHPLWRNTKGGLVLSAEFTEWHMGLLAGWVTDPAIWVGIPPATARRMQLHALGNGVVPQQAAEAYRSILEIDVADWADAFVA